MNKNIKILTSCAPPACSCPTAEMDDDTQTITIKDDYNGTTKMTYVEFTILAKKFLEHV